MIGVDHENGIDSSGRKIWIVHVAVDYSNVMLIPQQRPDPQEEHRQSADFHRKYPTPFADRNREL